MLFGLLSSQRPRLICALMCSCSAALLELLPYWLMSLAAAKALLGQLEVDELLLLAGGSAAALAGKQLCYSLAYYFSHVAAYRLLASIRRDLVQRLAQIPLIWVHAQGSGTLKKMVMQDVERLEQFIAHHSVELTAAVLGPLLAAGVLSWLDWRLLAAALLPLPLAILAQVLLLRNLGDHFQRFHHTHAELNTATLEFVRSMPVMKIYQQDARSFKRLRQTLRRYRATVEEVIRRTVPGWSLFTVLISANFLCLAPVALWLWQSGTLSMAQALLGMMLGSGMLQPAYKLTRLGSEISDILSAVRNMAPVLTYPTQPQRENGAAPVIDDDLSLDGTGEIRFCNIEAGYGTAPVLGGLSFILPAGQLTALVGPSGAGKSTVARLLNGTLQPSEGVVTWNGAPLSMLSDRARCSRIACVSQENVLFRGTLRDNLLVGNPSASESALQDALQTAQASVFVAKLPLALDTPMEEAGATLSGGERQRLCIARALVCDTPVLVLDEATAFADSHTEALFYRALRATYPGKTLLVIAHRLYAIRDADQILFLDRGTLLDQGRHETLLQRCPAYRHQWQRQTRQQHWTLKARGNVGA